MYIICIKFKKDNGYIIFVELVEHRNITDTHVRVCILPYERTKYKQYTNVCCCFGKRLFHTHCIRVTKLKANLRISERERERERDFQINAIPL